MSPNGKLPSATVELAVPPELVEAVALRVAELLTDRLPAAHADGYLDVDGAAAYLACPRSRIYDLVQLGRIAPRRDGRRLLFTRSDLDAALEVPD